MSTTDLVRVAPAPLLPMEPAQAALMMDRYRAALRVGPHPGRRDRRARPTGRLRQALGWSKLATFYGASTEIMELTVERDDDGQPIRARAVVRATAANGRHADGDGACAINEPRFRAPSGRQKAEHDLPATAVTRATNRSVSNLIGFGSVSAEVEPEEADHGPTARSPPAAKRTGCCAPWKTWAPAQARPTRSSTGRATCRGSPRWP
jgi:hypothetical protein